MRGNPAETLAGDDGTPARVTSSLPAQAAIDVAVDTRVAVLLSRPLQPETVTAATVTLTGNDGEVEARVVAAESGRLVFVTPRLPLQYGSAYTLTIAGVTDRAGQAMAAASMGFTTVDEPQPPADPRADQETWEPSERSRRDGWKAGRPPSPWESLAPLMAPPGTTAISGRVLTLDGRPLAGVSLSVEGGGEAVRSDRTGRFLLVLDGGATARRVLHIDGAPASRGSRRYGFFEYGSTVVAGRTHVLPFTIWMPKLDLAHQVSIPSSTTREVVVTTPFIPGLELHLPPGTTIVGRDGQPVRTIGFTAIPVDRPPFPLAKNVDVPVYFTVQPGGAYVKTSGAGPKGAWLVYPNYRQAPVGKRVQFFHYDPDVRDWYVYGPGTVMPGGLQVLPDPKTRIYEFTGAMINSGSSPPADAPPPGDCPCANDGDPVNLSTGLFTLDATDLYLSDVLPIAVTRTYRQRDVDSRAFGVGMTHPYAMFLWSALQYQEADLVLPDGAKIHYVRTSPGNGFTDAVFVHQETATTAATPTPFYKSTMTWNGNGWNVRLKDGAVYVFGENAPLQAIRDRFGNQVTITHANGQPGDVTQVTSPNGRWIAFTYDGSNRVTQAKDNVGRTVAYTYDGAGNLASVTDPEGHVTSYTYDGGHAMLTVKPPTLQGTPANLVTNEYTAAAEAPTPAGRVKKQTHADGGVFMFSYTVTNGRSTQTDVTDPRGFVRRTTFNSAGYMLTDTHAVGELEAQGDTNQRSTGNNSMTSSTDTDGNVTNTEYDELGRVRRVTRLPGTPDEAITTYTYDPVWTSEIATITDPLQHTTTFEYDARGNRKSIIDPLNHKTAFTFNDLGQVTSVTDPLQHTTAYEYAGRDLVKITDTLGRATERFYDGAGRLLTETDPARQTTRFTYDKVNHLAQVIDPLGGITTYGYDTAGRLGSVTDALNHATTYGYDAFDRLASRTDPLSKMETFTYDVNGNPAQHTDRKGQVTSLAYDALNRLQQMTHADNSTITYVYDAGNRLHVIDDSVNGLITRDYDDLDRLTSEVTSQGSISYTYDKADLRATMTVTGQPQVIYGYDDANRLTGVTQGTSSVTITYDDANRRSTLTLPNGLVESYGYNNANQLTSLTYALGQTTLGTLTYTYDPAGRRTAVGGTWARTGLPQPIVDATYDAANRIASWGGQTFSYDANGNVASDDLTSYSWNPRNQLIGLSGGVSASFTYDGLARWQSKSISATATNFLYDGINLVQELSGSTPSANLLTGLGIDETLTRTDAGGTRAFLIDALGSTVALADASGSVQIQYAFDPFGNTTSSGGASSNAVQFTGRENDGTGLYYYRARYYDPQRHRFASEDGAGSGGGISLYAYASNSPTNYIDPTGFQASDNGLAGDIQHLKNIFPDSTFDLSEKTLVIRRPCRLVIPVLRAQGYQDSNAWGYNGPGSAFWNPIDHPGGFEWRTYGPGFHFRMLYPESCGDKNCTLDQFHIDPHNPIEPGQMWRHIQCDFLHLCGQ